MIRGNRTVGDNWQLLAAAVGGVTMIASTWGIHAALHPESWGLLGLGGNIAYAVVMFVLGLGLCFAAVAKGRGDPRPVILMVIAALLTVLMVLLAARDAATYEAAFAGVLSSLFVGVAASGRELFEFEPQEQR